MWLRLVLLTVCLVISQAANFKESQVRYDDFKVYQVKVENRQQFQFIKTAHDEQMLSYWREIRELGEDCDVMVPPSGQHQFEQLLQQSNFTYNLKVENVQSLIEAQTPKMRTYQTGMEWTQYHTLDVIYAWLDEIKQQFPNIVTPFSIGKSYEGREIRGIKISYKKGNKAIFIEANIHGNEWIASATITYIINQLLRSKDAGVRDLAENLDLYLIPVLNPDGFEYSHNRDRLWRKSRARWSSNPLCVGTDLNRNFDFLWNVAGASTNPCSSNYAGPYPNSDPEVRQLQIYINETIPADTIKMYLSMHSFGQYLLSPWGHTDTEFPPNYAQMLTVAKGFADTVKQRRNTVYTYGSSATTLYKVSGASKDWAYGVKGIPLTYTLELPDKGPYGFLLPARYIIPVGEETVDGFVGLVRAARDNGVF